MASIFDVFGRLLLEGDGREFVAQARKAGEQAGDQAGRSMGQRTVGGLRAALGAGGRLLAGGASLAFAGMARGAMELEEVTARYRAETGATAEEAARAGKAINAIAGRQRLALEEVAEAAMSVRRNLGVTGEEADRLTESFARFARVTRQDAAGAVADFDDLLDTWGLDASRTQEIMDKLLVSTQRWGGDIQQQQKTLAQLAPALRAANFEIDDAIALLGLFGSKGLDANQGAAAFAKALTKVKSPAELQQLIADISATEDPFLRAQKAADLFGARAGAKLANALAGANLDDYAISLEDATGATERAADALDSTWGARFQRLMSEAGAAIRGFGADFGPALTGAASLASLGGALGLDKLLGKAFGKVATSALVRGAATKAGLVIGGVFAAATAAGDRLGSALAGAFNALPGSSLIKRGASAAGGALGSTLGKFAALGFAAVLWVEVFNTYNRIKAELGEQTAAIGDQVADQVKRGTTASLEQSKAALEQGLRDLDGVWDAGLFSNDTRASLQAQLDQVNSELARRAGAIPGAVGSELAAGAGEVEEGAEDMLDGVDDAVEDATADARAAAAKTPGEIADEIASKRDEVDRAWEQLLSGLEDETPRWVEQAELIAKLTSRELAEGLSSRDPELRARAQASREVWEKRLAELTPAGSKIGTASAEALRKGLSSKDPAIRTAAQRTSTIVETNIKPNTRGAGASAGQGVVDGLRGKQNAARDAARRFGQLVARNILGGILYTGGGRAAKDDVYVPGRARGGPVQPGRPYVVGERGPELFSPPERGTVVPAGLTKAVLRLVREGVPLEVALRMLARRGPRAAGGFGRSPLPSTQFVAPDGTVWLSKREYQHARAMGWTKATGGPVRAGRSYLGGEGGAELVLPSTRYGMRWAAGGGLQRQGRRATPAAPTVIVQGLMRARDPLELQRSMRRLSEFGVLTPAGTDDEGW